MPAMRGFAEIGYYNDKGVWSLNLLRWTLARTVKATFVVAIECSCLHMASY